MTGTIDCEIRMAIKRVEDANEALRNDSSEENQELVCVETRAAKAVFEVVSCWSGNVDGKAKRAVIKVLRESVQLLEQVSADPEILRAVKKRVREVREFDPAKVLR